MKKNVLMRTNVFVCVVIVIGFIITSLISYNSNLGIFKRNIESVSVLTSEGIHHRIDSIFTKPINISLTMANDSLLKNFLEGEIEHEADTVFVETMREYLCAYRDKYGYDSVFLVSARTNRYYYYNGMDRVLKPGDPENVWYYEFLNHPQEYTLNIDNDEVDTANNEITVFINCQIKGDKGEVMGVVGVGFRIDYIQEIFSEYEDGYQVRAYLIDGHGDIQISTDYTGYAARDLFTSCSYSDLEEEILSVKEGEDRTFWYDSGEKKGYLVSQYVPILNWHLLVENDTTLIEKRLNYQLMFGIFIIAAVITMVLLTITSIMRKYNREIVRLTIEKEKKHRAVFQTETEKIYENIYEIDITHNRAASEATEEYFVSLGVPKETPFDQALPIIAEKQIKEEYREGYLTTFCPENVLEAFGKGVGSLSYDFMISNDGGNTYYWMRITARIFYWDDDKSVRMFVYRQNVDEEKRHEKYMFEKMEQDSLTGLYNKAATQEHSRRCMKKAPDNNYAFFILDIDNFKEVNDTYGHVIGDHVIADFACLLKSQFRESDIVGRIGGDEFAVFVRVPSAEWVEKKAGNLVELLHHEYSEGTVRCRVSTSIGAAVVSESGLDFDTLYRHADTALYYTKKHGRNGYTLYRKQWAMRENAEKGDMGEW